MAIDNIFKEIDSILNSYNSHEAIRQQSETFITEVFYTQEWTRGVMFDIIKEKLGNDIDLTSDQETQIVNAARTVFRSETSKSKWEGYLTRAGFKILEGQLDSEDNPNDYDINDTNQVYVAELPGGGVKVRFYKSYTAEAGMFENHGTAQREYLISFARELAAELGQDGFAHSRRLGRRIDNYSNRDDGSSDFVADSASDFSAAVRYKGYRLHGNPGRHTGAGERSDTTRALLHLLTNASGRVIDDVNTNQRSLNFITKRLNLKLNAAYKIEGLDKIDLFKEQDISKSVVIKILFGTGAQNELMKQADKQRFPSEPSIDKLLSEIRDEFIDKWGKDVSKKGSKSVAELNALGAFALIPKEMKRASGLPDMRFKLNKQIMKSANLVEKSKGKKSSTIKKGSSRRVASNTVNSTKSLKSGRYNRNTTNSTTSLAALMQIVNAQLPRFLKRNMTPPRLQYRGKGNPSRPFAGPFNTGVEVTSLTDSKSNPGGLNVNYTYEKYPYQTFEPGFEQGSTLRDPRELIKESIRQIMITNKQNRFLRFRRH